MTGPKVVQLSRCDGVPSNVAIIVEGPKKGSIAHRQDGPMNCCPQLLRNIWNGDVPSPTFPHTPHTLDYSFLSTAKCT